MVAADVVNCIRESIDAQLAPRASTVVAEIQRTVSRMTPHVGALSGAVVHARGQIGCNELSERAKIIWNQIQRCYGTFGSGVNDKLADELRQQISEHLSAQCTGLLKLIDPQPNLNIPQPARAHVRDVVTKRRDELISEYSNEVRFYVEQLRRPSAATPSGIVIHGSVGAVMTGTNATAHVHIDSAGREQLVEALHRLASAIRIAPEMAASEREDTGELVSDLIATAKSDRPNLLKLRSLLSGLAVTIQTGGSLQPAWDEVCKIASAIGAWLQ